MILLNGIVASSHHTSSSLFPISSFFACGIISAARFHDTHDYTSLSYIRQLAHCRCCHSCLSAAQQRLQRAVNGHANHPSLKSSSRRSKFPIMPPSLSTFQRGDRVTIFCGDPTSGSWGKFSFGNVDSVDPSTGVITFIPDPSTNIGRPPVAPGKTLADIVTERNEVVSAYRQQRVSDLLQQDQEQALVLAGALYRMDLSLDWSRNRPFQLISAVLACRHRFASLHPFELTELEYQGVLRVIESEEPVSRRQKPSLMKEALEFVGLPTKLSTSHFRVRDEGDAHDSRNGSSDCTV